MRKILIALVLSSITTLPAAAALPPQYQRQVELQAIINSMDVVDAFGFDGIGSIEYVGDDLYCQGRCLPAGSNNRRPADPT